MIVVVRLYASLSTLEIFSLEIIFNMCIIMFLFAKHYSTNQVNMGKHLLLVETRLERTKKCGRKLILQVFLLSAKCLTVDGAKTNKEEIANRN